LKLSKRILVLVLFLSNQIFSQVSFQWAKTAGAPTYNLGNSIVTDRSGNVYTTGYFQGTPDFDPGPGVFTLTSLPAGKNDIFISKFDGNGNFIWAKRMGSTSDDAGVGIVVDQNCNVYTVGSYIGTVDFNPGSGTYLMSAAGPPGNSDRYVQKLDSLGNFIWAKQIGGSTIAIDDSANIYFACDFTSAGYDFDPGPSTYTLPVGAYVEKLDSAGNFAWAKSFGQQPIQVSAIKLDAQKNIYCTGSFGAVSDFDPGPGTYTLASKSSDDVFAVKLSSNGNFIWAKAIGSYSPDYGYAISVDKSKSVYLAGEFRGTCDFDPNAGTYNLACSGLSDSFVAKLDSMGNFKWAQRYGDNYGMTYDEGAYGLTNDALDNVYITGDFHGIVDFDPGPGTYTLSAGPSVGTYFAIYIQKLNSNGNLIWAGAMVCPNTAQNKGKAITIDKYNNIYSTGIAAPLDFDPGPATYTAGANAYNIYVHKLCQNPFISSISGPPVFCPSNNYILSVDPIPGATSFIWSLPSGFTGTSTTNSINVSTALSGGGALTLTVSNSCGISTKTLNVIITPTVPLAISNSSICIGNTGTISASGAVSFSWSTGATTNSITDTPTITSVYSVTGNAGGCASDTKTVSITVNPLPTVTASSPTFAVCDGTTSCLISGGALTYNWTGPCGFSSSSQNPCFPFNLACTCAYSVTGTDANGCKNTASVCITVIPNPTVTISTSNTLICSGQTATLTSNGANTYTWTPSASGSVIAVSPTTTANYFVTGTDINGCTNSTFITQNVSACTGINEQNFSEAISIYPNPVRDELKINSDKNILSIKMISTDGRIVFERKNIESHQLIINTSVIAQGIYFISCTTEEGEKYSRIIKN
jgi:hypothetical protein